MPLFRRAPKLLPLTRRIAWFSIGHAGRALLDAMRAMIMTPPRCFFQRWRRITHAQRFGALLQASVSFLSPRTTLISARWPAPIFAKSTIGLLRRSAQPRRDTHIYISAIVASHAQVIADDILMSWPRGHMKMISMHILRLFSRWHCHYEEMPQKLSFILSPAQSCYMPGAAVLACCRVSPSRDSHHRLRASTAEMQ